MGYIRADHDGYRWWNTCFKVNQENESPELISEFNNVYNVFTREFPNIRSLEKYCFEERKAEYIGDPTECNLYLELEHGNYWIRVITRKRDYNLYIHCYKK